MPTMFGAANGSVTAGLGEPTVTTERNSVPAWCRTKIWTIRNSSTIAMLKAVLAKGYRIIHPASGRQARPGNEAKTMSAAEGMLNQLRLAQENLASLELSVLLQVWNSRREDDRAWWCLPELYRQLVRRFLELSEAPLAREVAQTALQLAETDESGRSCPLWSHDVELRQIRSLALARSGNPDDAQRKLLKLRDVGSGLRNFCCSSDSSSFFRADLPRS